jgi:hypothetical protein
LQNKFKKLTVGQRLIQILERKWRLEKLEGTKSELYIQDREQKSKRKQELEQHLQKYTIQEQQQQQQERCLKIKWVLDV